MLLLIMQISYLPAVTDNKLCQMQLLL